MHKRVGSSLSVEIGTPRRFEAQPAIKAHRPGILFVDIGGQRGMEHKRSLDQRLADAFAMLIRIDEKRLHVPFVQKHEAEWTIRTIDRQRQRRLRQENLDLLPDRGAIRRQEKIMGGVDCPAPYVEDAGSVAAF